MTRPRGLHLRGGCRRCRRITLVKVVLWRASAPFPEGYCGPCRERIHNDGQEVLSPRARARLVREEGA